MPADQSAVVLFKAAGGEATQKTQQVVIDSLPYVDVVHEDYEQYALALIEDEMKQMKAPKLKPLPPPKFSKSDLLRNDYDSLSQNPDRTTLEVSNRAHEPLEHTVEAWREAVRDARAEFEAERQRSAVLEIEKSDASQHQWKLYGTMLEELERESSQRAEASKAAVDRLNIERQQHQEKAGQTIQMLKAQWYGAIQKRMQLQLATRDLKAQLEALKASTKCGNGEKG